MGTIPYQMSNSYASRFTLRSGKNTGRPSWGDFKGCNRWWWRTCDGAGLESG